MEPDPQVVNKEAGSTLDFNDGGISLPDSGRTSAMGEARGISAPKVSASIPHSSSTGAQHFSHVGSDMGSGFGQGVRTVPFTSTRGLQGSEYIGSDVIELSLVPALSSSAMDRKVEPSSIIYYGMRKQAKTWTEGQMTAAIEDVLKKKLTLRAASALYGIPRATLFDRMHSRRDRSDKSQRSFRFSLPPALEEELRLRAKKKYGAMDNINLASFKEEVFEWAKSAWIQVHQDRLNEFPHLQKSFKAPEPNDSWFGRVFLKDDDVKYMFAKSSIFPPVKLKPNSEFMDFTQGAGSSGDSLSEKPSSPSSMSTTIIEYFPNHSSLNGEVSQLGSFARNVSVSSDEELRVKRQRLDLMANLGYPIDERHSSSDSSIDDQDIVKVEPVSPCQEQSSDSAFKVPVSHASNARVAEQGILMPSSANLKSPVMQPKSTVSKHLESAGLSTERHVQGNLPTFLLKENSLRPHQVGKNDACAAVEGLSFRNFENPEEQALKNAIKAVESSLSSTQLSMFLDRYYSKRPIDRLYDIWAGLMDKLDLLKRKDTV